MVDERVLLSLRFDFQIFQLVIFPLFEILNLIHSLKISIFIRSIKKGKSESDLEPSLFHLLA